MPPLVHGLKLYKYDSASYPQFRYHAECLCGFATKNVSAVTAETQLLAHLEAHGFDITKFEFPVAQNLPVDSPKDSMPALEGEEKEPKDNVTDIKPVPVDSTHTVVNLQEQGKTEPPQPEQNPVSSGGIRRLGST